MTNSKIGFAPRVNSSVSAILSAPNFNPTPTPTPTDNGAPAPAPAPY